MSDDKNKKHDKNEQEPTQTPQPTPFYQPPFPTGTMYNNPSGSTANPMGGQAIIIGQALSQLQSFSFQKEPNPEIVKAQYEVVKKVSDNWKDENLKYLEYQESRDIKDHDIITKRGNREFYIIMISLITVILIIFAGLFLLFTNKSIEGASLVAGGLGTILGFLGGLGISKRT